MDDGHSEPLARLNLPSLGGATSVAIFSTTITFFVVVAIYNLANYRDVSTGATILSLIWLMLVTTSICVDVEDKGIRNFVVNRMAPFSHQHYVESWQQPGADQLFRFCFMLFNRHFTLMEIPAAKITSIEWSAGQATSMAGRDMDDWYVVIWYHREGAKRWISVDDYREETPYIVGPSGPKKKTVTTGKALVSFLESMGVVFIPTPNDWEFFTRKPRSAG